MIEIERELAQVIAYSALTWATRDENSKNFSLIKTVPSHLCTSLVEEIRSELKKFNLHKLEPSRIEVYELSLEKDLKNLNESQVNADKSLEKRNQGVRCLLIAPGGIKSASSTIPSIPSSIESAFDAIDYLLVLQLAAQELYSRCGGAEVELLGALGIENWLNGSSVALQYTEGWAHIVAMVALGAERRAIGQELWRVGLIPDVGFDDVTKEDFTSRLKRNSEIVKALGGVIKGKNLEGRLAAVNVGLTPVTRKVISVLSTRVLTSPAGESGWCRSLISDELTLDKWDLEPDFGDLELLSVLPFRDLTGAVISSSKLKQDKPNTFSETLFLDIGFNEMTGEAKSPPSVMVQWDTTPKNFNHSGKWRVSLVIPVAYRRPDEPPILVQTVKRSSVRKHSFKFDISRDDLPDGLFGETLLVAIEVAALSLEDDMVLRCKNGKEALSESDEFELRFTTSDDPDKESNPSTDNAVSPAAAILSVVLEEASAPFTRGYGLKEERSLLDIQFLDSDAKTVAIRSVRTIPRLLRLQQKLITDHPDSTYIRLSLNPNEVMPAADEFVKSSRLPEALLRARLEYFKQIRKFSKTQSVTVVETLEWEPEVCAALDEYITVYRQLLSVCDGELATELLLLDTVQIAIFGSKEPLLTTVVLPTHPLRSMWLREYWHTLMGWHEQALGLEVSERASAIDIELVNRISLGNLPFVSKTNGSQFHVYAEEAAFGYGIYVSPKDSDHEAMVSLTIAALGSDRSHALQSNRLAALRRNVAHYIERRRHPDVLAIAALNVGDGGIISNLMSQYFAEATDSNAANSDFRLEVTAYSESHWIKQPAKKLAELQTRLRDISRSGLSHLSPLIGLSIRSREHLTTDRHSVHLSIVQGIATGEIERKTIEDERKSYLGGLITGTQTTHFPDTRHWHVTPTGGQEFDRHITNLHKLLLAAQGRQPFQGDGSLGLTIMLSPDTAADIRALHVRSDRVMTLDRYVGLDWFINSRALGLGASYVLDYTPDFVEGLADRLIVTTQHPKEADRVVEKAMSEMGLDTRSRRSQVIENLNLVSGRLVLRLMTANPQAYESIGLAVVMAVLRSEGDLDKWFVIPVDSHLEIFGSDASAEVENRRRCDMLLVCISENMIEIRCVEVKERRSLPISDQLRRRIQDQLNSTEEVIEERYFAGAHARIDHELQIAHFSSILHHYIDRARDHELLPPSTVKLYHGLVDQLGQLDHKVTKEAFVVSIESEGRPKEDIDEIKIRYLTSADLELTTFCSTVEANRRTTQGSDMTGDEQGVMAPSPSVRVEDSQPDLSSRELRSPGPKETSSEQVSVVSQPPSAKTPPVEATPKPSATPVSTFENGVGVEQQGALEKSVLIRDENERVEIVTPKLVTVDLGIDAAGQPVAWHVSTKGSPHAFVLGITGQGKSVTTRHVISTFAEQGLPSLVIDVHGDMAASPPRGASVLDVREEGLGFSPFYLSGHGIADVSESAFEIAEVFAYVCDLGEMQLANVFKAIKKAYLANGWVNGELGERLPTIEEFATQVEAIEKGARGRNARERLLPLTDFGLFQDSTKQFDPRGSGGGLVVDLHKFKLEKVIRAATSLVLRKVYREMFLWPQDSTLKLAIVLDEAHRIAKDPTLPKLLKEGRKYGVACFVASQSISDFDDDVKNNSGTKIVFRTNFPESKDVSGLIRGAEKIDFAKQIEQLGVGEAFVSTADLPRARKCKMRGRNV